MPEDTPPIELDDHRPHVLIVCGPRHHVFPLQCLTDIVSGNLPVTALEPEVWRRILEEWLQDRGGDTDE